MFVSVLGIVYLEAIPGMMAYAATKIRVSQDFAGLTWQHYNSGFCRQAIITGSRQWSRINATLLIYTMCFTGKALAITRCERCFASTHMTIQCRLQGDADLELPACIKVIESAMLYIIIALAANQEKPDRSIRASVEPCRQWSHAVSGIVIDATPLAVNMNTCIKCRGNYQAMVCPNNYCYQGPQGTQAVQTLTCNVETSTEYRTGIVSSYGVLHNLILNLGE